MIFILEFGKRIKDHKWLCSDWQTQIYILKISTHPFWQLLKVALQSSSIHLLEDHKFKLSRIPYHIVNPSRKQTSSCEIVPGFFEIKTQEVFERLSILSFSVFLSWEKQKRNEANFLNLWSSFYSARTLTEEILIHSLPSCLPYPRQLPPLTDYLNVSKMDIFSHLFYLYISI